MERKNKPLLMKFKVLCALVAGSMVAQTAIAQTYVPATKPDNTWLVSSTNISFLNTAMISYGNIQSPGTLFACNFYGNPNPGGVLITDLLNPAGTFFIPAPMSNPMVSPDIVIGNSLAAPLTDYIVAAAYSNSANNPEIDYYKVHYTGVGIFTVTPAGSTIVASIGFNVHIDLISEASNTGPTGFPFANKFVIAWTNGTSSMYAAASTLNAPPAVIPASSCVYIGPGVEGDVAAIERTVGSAVNNIALITYIDNTSNTLYYTEWNTAGTIVGPTTVLDAGSTSSAIRMPRIDAIDDRFLNSSATVSKYKVVAQATNLAGNTEVRSYDNLILGTHFTVSSVVNPPSFPPGPYNSTYPSVAYGALNSTNYNIAHFTLNPSAGQDLFMEPIEWMHPLSIATPPNKYYQVNLSAPFNVTGPTNSISTPVNDWSYNVLVAWANYSSTGSTIFYKVTSAPTYTFRSTGVETTQALKIWQVYPNPTTDHITINNPDVEGKATAYAIIDMSGRIVAQGNMQTGAQSINTSQYATGNYVLKLYNGTADDGNVLFVKQ
jgi:hypothetical protein